MHQNKFHQFGIRSETGTYSNSEIGQDAEVYGSPRIIDSKVDSGFIFERSDIISSTIAGLPVMTGKPTVVESFIGGQAKIIGYPYIYQSMISGTAIVTGTSRIDHSILNDDVKVIDNAKVSYAELRHSAWVSGDAKVIGTPEKPILLDGFTYIHRGTWTRPQIWRQASSGFTLNECTDGNVDIGCICNKPEKFLKAGTRYLQILGFTKEQADEIRELLFEIQEERKQYEF